MKVKLKSMRNMLVAGAHVGEGEAFETEKSTATMLINMKKAVVLDAAGEKAMKKAAAAALKETERLEKEEEERLAADSDANTGD